MAPLAYGGLSTRLGFGTLAVLWLACGFTAYRRIRARQIQSHRQWMVRTYALTFAGVMLRLWSIALTEAGVPFDEAYLTVAWWAWVPNQIVAELIVASMRKGPSVVGRAF
jgi:hypothetical protein